MASNYNKINRIYRSNFLNKENCQDDSQKMYKLHDIDNPNGWAFSELDMLGEMQFKISDDYKMVSEIEIPSLEMDDKKVDAYVYKTDEGYTLQTEVRKYTFETFDKMIEFIDSIPLKKY